MTPFFRLVPALGCLLGLAASLVTAAESRAPGTGPDFKGPVGLQLYSLRADFIRNVPTSLQKVKELGFRKVELAGTYNLEPAKFKQMLDAHGLEPVSGHFPFERYKDDPEGVAREAKALGLKYAGCAWIPHQDAFDESECRTAIETFNRAGEVLRRHGIRFFYHCHGYEFQPHAAGTFMDLLLTETKRDLVAFEMDVFWVTHPGHDPVQWLRKYPGRWELIHLKDMKKGLATGSFTGKTDVSNDVALGTGQMNWPAILKAARETGVKWYFIEDESPSVLEQIPVSLRYLEQVRF